MQNVWNSKIIVFKVCLSGALGFVLEVLISFFPSCLMVILHQICHSLPLGYFIFLVSLTNFEVIFMDILRSTANLILDFFH